MDDPVVIDDFYDSNTLEFLQKEVASPKWEFGQRSVPETQFPMWYQKIYYAGDTISNFFYRAIADKFCRTVNDYFGEYVGIERIMLCGNTYGQDGDVHRDRQEPGNYTGVLHITPNFKPHWGGETVIYTDPITTVEFKPNRMIIFPSNIPHIGKDPIRSCGQLRSVLSLMAQVNV